MAHSSMLKKRNGGGVAQSESEKAAEFNGQFTDVFTKSEYSQVPLLDRSAPFMEDIVVTKEGDTGCPHDGRADKDSYPHHGRADKDSYPHDGRADKDSYPHDRYSQYIMFSL